MSEHRSAWTCERCGNRWTIVVEYEGPAADPARTLKRAGIVSCPTPGCPRERVVLVDSEWAVAELSLVPSAE